MLYIAIGFTRPVVGIAAALCILVGCGGLGWQKVSSQPSGGAAMAVGEGTRA